MSGHVFRIDRARGPVWVGGSHPADCTPIPGHRYAKYRLPDGRQVQKRVGPAWTERGRPPAGYVTKRLAEAWLRDLLDQARRGSLPGMVRTGATFADAAAEYVRHVEEDRGCKPSTVRNHRSVLASHLLPRFGSEHVEDITPAMTEAWRAALGRDLSPRTKNGGCVSCRDDSISSITQRPVADLGPGVHGGQRRCGPAGSAR